MATSASPVGSYASSCSGAGDPNYTFIYVGGSVSVTPKAAVITASSATMTEGDDAPAITPCYSGLVNGDTAAATAADVLHHGRFLERAGHLPVVPARAPLIRTTPSPTSAAP